MGCAANAASEIVQASWLQPKTIDYKCAINLVASVDKECESKIVATIRRDFADHSILAEEETQLEGAQREYRWIVDPLDGTTNFAHGYPQLVKRPERTLTAFPPGDRKFSTRP